MTTIAYSVNDDASHDRSSIIFDGQSPNKLACDTTLRLMPNGDWVMVMLGGDEEPLPQNQVFYPQPRRRAGVHARVLLSFQHYLDAPEPRNPRNGVRIGVGPTPMTATGAGPRTISSS